MVPRDIAKLFPAIIRTRGDAYFSEQRARSTAHEPARFQATVSETKAYDVVLKAKRGTLAMTCGCPYAFEYGQCKHIWAAVRLADAEGALGPLLREAGPDMSVRFGEVGARPEWKQLMATAQREMSSPSLAPIAPRTEWPADQRLIYIVDFQRSWQETGILIDLALETQRADGSWSDPVRFKLTTKEWHAVPDPTDRQIAQMLTGAQRDVPATAAPSQFTLGRSAFDTTLALMCDTGRCRARWTDVERPPEPVRWDGEPWRLALRVQQTPRGEGLVLEGVLTRGEQTIPLAKPDAVHPAGLLCLDGFLAPFDHGGAWPIARTLRGVPRIPLAEGELPELLEALYGLRSAPAIELPPDIHITEERSAPRPWLSVTTTARGSAPAHLALRFQYGDAVVAADHPEQRVFDRRRLAIQHRDPDGERAARLQLKTLGAREQSFDLRDKPALTVPRAKVSRLVTDAIAAGWRVEVSGAAYRMPGAATARVRSGIDWFDLDFTIDYDGVKAALPDRIDALRKGSPTVTLADGSVGLLPADWLARLGPAIAAGRSTDGVTRFTRSQVGLLDALLETLPDASVDETFQRAREQLDQFEGIEPLDPPPSFTGTLRHYQREGLGWLQFLRAFGLGGCLADDMGLGKTVQVLALLEAERVATPSKARGRHPSIVVVPRSLVFNWSREAQRFAPELRVLDYTQGDRRPDAITRGRVDVVLTTYGTLRRDIVHLREIDFAWAVLDEAQTIKNPGTAAAKAARLLRARYRLALSGTPIENRLEELWSLFEFLNPGMLGSASIFNAMALAVTDADDPAAAIEGRAVLSRALRPLILRRTKGQVAPELPERVEQTLYVELEPRQRKFYDTLLERSRRTVFDEVDRVGVGRARMHILEALLRLRQAACHPVLADPTRADLPSAKLDALVPALSEVVAEGHKVVVFSQFTSFLALVRARLDEASILYEYLDGRTRDRQARVERFQSVEGPPVFLVSLKAGGHGLNLTAADYVHLLDPWWNPAVEAQAIDRTHRIGQTRRVIATRFIARGTVEEKVLELQATKRSLADAILSADQGVLSKIGRSELEMLLT